MASSGTRRRSSAARRARPATPVGTVAEKVGKTIADKGDNKKVAKHGARKVAEAVASADGSGALTRAPKGLAKAAAKKTAKVVLSKALESGAKVIRSAADRATVASQSAIEAGARRRLPIQLSIDVAVPINVAWEQWRTWGSLPEGIHRIESVERKGDALLGHTAGPRAVDWEAEILDEREDESFAWRSVEGTDCAGLATFHQISERLTRIELDLDVLPTSPPEALTFALHLAHHRAEADLRRFKAHVEFINPDVYESYNGRNAPERANGARKKQG